LQKPTDKSCYLCPTGERRGPWEFPGCPVVKIPLQRAQVLSLVGKILHAMQCGKKINKNERERFLIRK